MFLVLQMLTSIELDNESFLDANKIDYEVSDRVLTPEFMSGKLAVPERIP